jgi:hypothetical protein
MLLPSPSATCTLQQPWHVTRPLQDKHSPAVLIAARADFWHTYAVLTGKFWLTRVLTAAGFAVLGGLCFAQTAAPTVTFTFDFPGSEPGHYVISVAADGKSSYDSNGKLAAESDPGDTFRLEFVLPHDESSRIFDLARKAKYFHGQIDSKKSGLASTGVKILAYKDGANSSEATYNYSPLAAVQQLTDIFQGMSNTLEFGRRLQYFHRYQKLALAEELKRADNGDLGKDMPALSAIAPILKKIVDDPSVINVVRARAQKLLVAEPSNR